MATPASTPDAAVAVPRRAKPHSDRAATALSVGFITTVPVGARRAADRRAHVGGDERGLAVLLGRRLQPGGGGRAEADAASRRSASPLLNAVLGTITAWVLVRDDFRGKSLVNAIIDLPFALPTIVAGLDAARALRPDVADRHQRRLHADGDRALPDVRDAAVRRPHRAAGARGARPRGGAGRALARRVAADDVPPRRLPEHPARASSPASRSRSRRPSASSGRS